MFIPKFYLDGAADCWERMPADAGTYEIGEALVLSGGKLTVCPANSKPEYICMCRAEVESGEDIAVIAVSDQTQYESEFSEQNADAQIGGCYQISADGGAVTATGGGACMVLHFEGTEQGSCVVVRFVDPAGA